MHNDSTPSNASRALNLLAQAVCDADPSTRELAISRFSAALLVVLERRLSHEFRMGDQQDLPDDIVSYQELWSGAANWGVHVALDSLRRGEQVENILALAYTAAWRNAVDELRKLAIRRPVRARPEDEVLNGIASCVAVESPLDRLEMRTLAQHLVRSLLSELQLVELTERHAYAGMIFHVLIDEIHPPVDLIARELTAAVRASHPAGLSTATKEMLALALCLLHTPTARVAQTLALKPSSVASYVKRARARLRRVTNIPAPAPASVRAPCAPTKKRKRRTDRESESNLYLHALPASGS